MMPELPPESLVVSRHALDDGDIWVNEKGCKAGIVTFMPAGGFRLTLTGDSGQQIILEQEGKNLTLYEKGRDDGRYRAPMAGVSDVTLCFDAGIVEVFANQGSVCGTRRYYSCSQLTRIQLSGAPAQLTQYRSTYSQE
ncbi:hypothetical protein AZ036_000251 [Klebsiella michiganensis]|nr:hypothetical protein AZ036_000251 [Klebsiella michiganensis]